MRKAAGIMAPFRLLPMVAAVASLAACSDIRPLPDAEEGILTGSSAQDVDPVQLRKDRGGGGGGGGY